MELTVLGSSSRGNGYVLQNETEALIIECGVSLLEVKKAVGFNVSKIVGALCSHEHGDHAKYTHDFLHSRINVYMSHGTMKAIETKGTFLPLLMEAGNAVKIGSFTVLPFGVKHDAAEPLGFHVSVNEHRLGVLLCDSSTQ